MSNSFPIGTSRAPEQPSKSLRMLMLGESESCKSMESPSRPKAVRDRGHAPKLTRSVALGVFKELIRNVFGFLREWVKLRDERARDG